MFIELIKSVRIRTVEQVALTLAINVCRILVGNAKGERLFGKHRYEGEDNIEIDLKEI
jgi:hypothetical protein